MSQPLCQLCLEPAAESASASDGNTRLVCNWCGSYTVSQRWIEAKSAHTIIEPARTRLRGVVRQDTDEHDECRTVISTDNAEQLIARHDQPRDSIEQMERLLVLLADRSPYFGAKAHIDSWKAMAVRIYLPKTIDTDWGTLVQALNNDGYLHRHAEQVTLTHKGWSAAQVARRTMRSGNQAFVAMWFHPGMDVLFDKGIDPALRACGYAPYVVNREQHNNKIDDQIIANILKSRLFIGDLTGMRPNVFYEAGFAHGHRIPVLLTCNESYTGCFVDADPDLSGRVPKARKERWFKQVSERAFDVRQYLITTWITPEDLATKLELRIRAMELALPT